MPTSARQDARRVDYRLLGISKRFGGVQAVDGVTLSIEAGSIHALVGENGAGKSTLGRVLAGMVEPDEGTIHVDGREVRFHSPRDALAHGVAAIAQEIALVPSLSAAANVFLGVEPRRLGLLSKRQLAASFEGLCREVGFDLPATGPVSRLRLADQQKTEILRAVACGASLIIMDEPSAALSRSDVERLHSVIRDLAASGRTVLLISHSLSEVLALADTVTVLRDGKVIRTAPAAEETEATLIEAMLGRSLGALYPEIPEPEPESPVLLEVRSLSAPGVSDASFSVRAGEIVGLAGLIGAGRSELALAIYGANRRDAGRVTVCGKAYDARSPHEARQRGVFMIPESRKQQGLIAGRPVRENVTLGNLSGNTRLGMIRTGHERGVASRAMEEATVRAPHTELAVSRLSGGNQQKVLFARGIASAPRVLIADEPTRGVDIGSRQAIYELLRRQAEEGTAILLISSDVEEVIGLAHRVLVMRGGRIAAELTGSDISPANILTAAILDRTSEVLR
ncbi:MAG: sugar ABC transporter ATP-binding protein [Acidimicrobiaceae bacterium]|nr:sugar ABC transporter ATP-binding protein [Acidimicrobiaceae bacterium]